MKATNQAVQDPISIVIPTYNRVNMLKNVIGSYMFQKGVREILVVDDGSNDGTEEFMLSLQKTNQRVVYIRNSKNLGLPATRNVGVEHSSGDFVLFGEDDLRFAPDYAERLIFCLKKMIVLSLLGESYFHSPERPKQMSFNVHL